MKGQDYEQLTLFPADSPVNLSALPGHSAARRMTVTSGQRCVALYRNSSPLGCLVKTCLVSSIWHSTRCYLTWKPLATKHKRLLFQLAVSTPHIKGFASALWPTMTATVHGKKRYAQGGKPLTMAYAEKFGDAAMTPEFVEWLMGYEQEFTKLIPTPRAQMGRTAPLDRFLGGGVQTSTGRIAGSHSAWEDWPDEPDVGRVVDGLPYRVDRLKCLGNAVVPQAFYPFFKAIYDIETGAVT